MTDSHQQTSTLKDPPHAEDVLVNATVPCDDLALSDTFANLPEAHFEVETSAGMGDNVFPLMWGRGQDQDRLEGGLREDATTNGVTRLMARGEEFLYRISWAPTVRTVVWMFTREGSTILDASADHGEWRLRVLYPSRRVFRDAMHYCGDHDISIEIQSVRQLTGNSSRVYGLTELQYRSLRLACERGYYDVPRETDLGEIAQELGISHQALSERLRRATQKLITQALFSSQSGEQCHI